MPRTVTYIAGQLAGNKDRILHIWPLFGRDCDAYAIDGQWHLSRILAIKYLRDLGFALNDAFSYLGSLPRQDISL